MIRVLVLYAEQPDAEQYAAHTEVCRTVPGATFRHGSVFGAPMGEQQHRYYAEFEFPDRESFDTAVRSEQFMATAKDLQERGLPMPTVEFVELS